MSVCKKPEGRQAASQAGIVRDHMLMYCTAGQSTGGLYETGRIPFSNSPVFQAV